jgi:hypothetical protein
MKKNLFFLCFLQLFLHIITRPVPSLVSHLLIQTNAFLLISQIRTEKNRAAQMTRAAQMAKAAQITKAAQMTKAV